MNANEPLWPTDRYAQVVWVYATHGTALGRSGYPNVATHAGGLSNQRTNAFGARPLDS